MVTRQIEIKNKKGLHARAAAKLINLAHRFKSEVTLTRGETEANGKSILGLLMLAAHQGTWLTIRAEGDDEQETVDSICKLIESNFEESE